MGLVDVCPERGVPPLTPPPSAEDLNPPPKVFRLPYPTLARLQEIRLNETLDCSETCAVSVRSNASVATVQLTRLAGAVSADECNAYTLDRQNVEERRLSLYEFAARIHQGFYYTYDNAAEGYCRELGMSDSNLYRIAQGEAWSDSMLLYKSTRPVSGTGGFSGNTKAMFEFSVPLDLTFSGKTSYLPTSADTTTSTEGFREHFLPYLIAAGVMSSKAKEDRARGKADREAENRENTTLNTEVAANKEYINRLTLADVPFATEIPSQTAAPEVQTVLNQPVSVKHMALYYPSPIQINGKQHEAMLALNDPSAPTSNGSTVVVLVPLKSSTFGDEPSADFFRQICKYLPAIRDIDPMTGFYPRATIQTGSGWSLSKLFNLKDPTKEIPGLPDVDPNTRLLIDNGFYVWKSQTNYLSKVVETTNPNFPSQTIRWEGWEPDTAANSITYVMLDSAVAIDSVDLVTLTRILPATPVETAIHAIPSNEKYIFHKTGTPPPDTDNAPGGGSKAPGCSTNLCKESYMNFNSAIDLERVETQFDTLQSMLKGDFSKTEYADLLKGCPGAKCDVFLQNLKEVKLPDHRVFMRAIYAILFLLATVVGIYFALLAVSHGYETKVTDVGTLLGKLAGVFARRMQASVQQTASTPPPPAPAGPSAMDSLLSLFRKPKPV